MVSDGVKTKYLHIDFRSIHDSQTDSNSFLVKSLEDFS